MSLSPQQAHRTFSPYWMLIPLRLFLGITFLYAGLQKLSDPQFFNPAAPGYIGRQILGFAHGSPLHVFLITVAVPHAHAFGLLVAYGELAIGAATLLGFLLRPAAFFGLLLSCMFFLSASWRVYPFFYGADIVFVFCWLTLLGAGASRTGLPALDSFWIHDLLPPAGQARLAPVLAVLLGADASPQQVEARQAADRQVSARPAQQSKYAQARRALQTRRTFLLGALTGGAGMLALSVLWHLLGTGSSSPISESATPVTPASAGTTATTSAGGGATIARLGSVQENSSVSFTLASNGDPGILVRLQNGDFVAYDAVCTHAGCTVDYDPSSRLLICPCHGAEFDPSKAAAVVQGPAPTPLTRVAINVDGKSGTISTQQ